MLTQRQLFFEHLAQTSDSPIELEIEKAEGVYLYTSNGKKYFDLISGISVSNIGHRHPKVVESIKKQLDKYMYLMVYGEYIQSPQVKFAKLLSDNLPENLNCTYFVNSGSEAVEGALKLAKRYTGKTEIISFKNAYHGSTHGALSVMGNEDFKNSFRPLVPGVKFLEFNNINDLKKISKNTACVIVEPIQAEAGVIQPKNNFLIELRKKCDETDTLLIFDEIQTGFGRTGSLFCFSQYNVIPDIITFAKGMAGGMPLGAFISSKKIMEVFMDNPVLGHITTFGGHPVSCAAAIANLEVILNENIIENVNKKGELFKELISNHPLINSVRHKGLMMAFELDNFDVNKKFIKNCRKNGVIIDWFLFADNSFRIAPPLIISEQQIIEACKIIIKCLNEIK